MPIYQRADSNMLAAMTTKDFEFSWDIAHEQGADLGVVVLGDEASDGPVVMLLDLPPGHVLVRHAHNTPLRGLMPLAASDCGAEDLAAIASVEKRARATLT